MNKLDSLTPTQKHILIDKGTEAAFSGKFINTNSHGTYLCRQCGLALFRASSQFTSGCGWPSFDDEITGSIRREADKDGRRTEILCARCAGHLGHVFSGEYITQKNLRHCVNSISVDFVLSDDVKDTSEIIVAGGCFWGVQYLLAKENGVLLTEVGYIGGHTNNPSYSEVCSHQTGHVEAVRVIFDKDKITDEAILKLFFEIHNPFQIDGQGPDIGGQYLSKIFVYDETQKQITEKLIAQLNQSDQKVATTIEPVTTFWPAEEFHQDYYEKTGKAPYCHTRVKRF